MIFKITGIASVEKIIHEGLKFRKIGRWSFCSMGIPYRAKAENSSTIFVVLAYLSRNLSSILYPKRQKAINFKMKKQNILKYSTKHSYDD